MRHSGAISAWNPDFVTFFPELQLFLRQNLIRGSMEHAEGQFLSGRNKFVAKVTIPKAYTKGLSENGVPVKVRGGERNPALKRLLDQVYDVANLVLTSNSVASLKGSDLKFSKNDPKQGKVYKVCLKTLDPETGDLVVKSLKHPLTADIVPDPDMPEPADVEEEQVSSEESGEQEAVLREERDETIVDGGVQVAETHIPVSDSPEVVSSTVDDVVDSSESVDDTGQSDSEFESEEDPEDDVDDDSGSDE